MVNLSKVLKVKVPPVAILISGLVVVGLLTAEAGILHYGSEIKSYEAASAETLKEQTEQLTQNYKDADKKTAANQASTNNGSSRYINGSSYAAGANSGGPASSTYSGSSSVHSKTSYAKVFLSINGSPKGTVNLKSTANQCEVLSRAQAQGLISSLVMKYNDSLNSFGVYVIDGIGRTDQVYWTYTVNGKPPPLGCSYITVHGGDSINWRYIN